MPDRRSMPLLQLITAEALELDYQYLADRRRAVADAGEQILDGGKAKSRHKVRLTGMAIMVFGLLIALAAVQNSRNAALDQESRDALIGQINDARTALASTQATLATLRQENAKTDTTYRVQGTALAQAQGQVATLGRAAGFAAVSGSGVVAEVNDNPDGDASGEVRDSDLAALANGLFSAGATAVAVNGQRLTALSALRNSGSVIRVDTISLSPPYTVVALGDTKTLLARFAQTASGRTFHDVTTAYGMPTSFDTAHNLTVPAAPVAMLALSYATIDNAPTQEER